MTLDSKLSKAVYDGNGSTTVFPFAFKVWNTSHIAVTVTDSAGVSTDVTSNSAVTLTSSGGSVSYPNTGSPLPTGAKLAITRNMPFTQGINLTTASRFDPQVLEDGLDQATAERQQTLEMMARAVILPPTSSDSPQDVVATIYASRDAAAASATSAGAQATAAQAAAISASTAAQTVATAAAEAVSAATVQAEAAANSADAAAESAAEAKSSIPSNLVSRVTAVETVAAAAKAVTDTATATPTSNAVIKADTNGKADGWITARPNFYGTCATASATADKVVTCSDFVLFTGAELYVNFANANTVQGALTLNVNGTGAKSIAAPDGLVSASKLALFPSGCLIKFHYDGTYWRFSNDIVKGTYTASKSGSIYADGKKVQWGKVDASANSLKTITFLYEFTDTGYAADRGYGYNYSGAPSGNQVALFSLTTTTCQTYSDTNSSEARWRVEGY